MRRVLGFERTVCDCEECATNCMFLPGYLIPSDLIHMGKQFGYADTLHFARQNLLASPGALVSKQGRLIRIPTLVPARNANGWCRFFDGKHCEIHQFAPFGCSHFDVHQSKQESDIRSAAGLKRIMQQWDYKSVSIYCQAWEHLHDIGLRAPSAEECRARMVVHLNKKMRQEEDECSGILSSQGIRQSC